MTDRRTYKYLYTRMNRRKRLMDRRQHTGPFRLVFILFLPVSEVFRRFVWEPVMR
jgi:hypothetical protein